MNGSKREFGPLRAHGLLVLALGIPALVGGGAGSLGHGLSASGVADPLSSRSPESLHCTEPEARSFDFWIGEWDVLNRNRRPDGVEFYPTGRATDKVHTVVGGCAVVEHWRGDAIGRYILGFSIRAYDRRSQEWVIALLWPTTGVPSFGELRGGFRHGRGQFSHKRVLADGDTAMNRFVFSDIRPDSLRWENGTSRDGGRSWVGHWIMEFTRRSSMKTRLSNGPSMTTRRCPGEAHRRFDPSLGQWHGSRITARGDSMAVRTELIRILEGCGVVERTRSLDGSWEAFRVRAWEPDAERWVEYAIDSERRTLDRREADGTGSTFRAGGGRDGSERRVIWEPGAGGAPGWVVEERERPGAPWRLHSVLRFNHPLGGA